MFDNVYWHHTNRAMMAMLLRAVQEALAAGRARPATVSVDARRRLAAGAALQRRAHASRRPAIWWARCGNAGHTRCCWRSARARDGSTSQLDALFWDQAKRRRVEIALAEALAVAWSAGRAARCPDGCPQAGEVGDGCAGALRPSAARHGRADDLDGGDGPASRATSASTSSISAASASWRASVSVN